MNTIDIYNVYNTYSHFHQVSELTDQTPAGIFQHPLLLQILVIQHFQWFLQIICIVKVYISHWTYLFLF